MCVGDLLHKVPGMSRYGMSRSAVGAPLQMLCDGVQSAEVLLLDRNVIIQGAYESNRYLGGHAIWFQTGTPQFVIGVELINMGQQGSIGRSIPLLIAGTMSPIKGLEVTMYGFQGNQHMHSQQGLSGRSICDACLPLIVLPL